MSPFALAVLSDNDGLTLKQKIERALTGITAGLFDHGAHAFPDLHRRLRTLLCRGVGVDLASNDNRGGGLAGGPAAAAAAAVATFEAHAWEEEAPQAQLNGGSDPVVVTASHVVHHGGAGGGRGVAGGQGGEALGPAASVLAFVGGGGGAGVAPGKAASRGVRIRVRVYNATNTRLHGFSIRLSFGQGGEAAGMGSGGRVESAVHEVRAGGLLPLCADSPFRAGALPCLWYFSCGVVRGSGVFGVVDARCFRSEILT